MARSPRWWTLVAGSLIGSGVEAQVAVRRLTTPPLWEAPAGFTEVRGVRELPSGIVVILDAGDQAVLRFDPSTRHLSPVGRTGSGPAEYRFPTRLLPLAAGQTGILDPPNARILVLGPDGVPAHTTADRPVQVGGIDGLAATPPVAADGAGRFYSQAQSATLRPGGTWQVVDSAAIERWAPGEAGRDTVAFVPVTLPPGVFVSQGTVAAPPTALQPFTRFAQWAVAADGWVAVVHPAPYRVTLFAPGGQRRQGPQVLHTPVRLTAGDKARWLADRRKPRRQFVYPGGGGSPYVRTVTPSVPEPSRWPVVLPPTTGEPPLFDIQGRLWVGRTTPHGVPRRYDIFDRRARQVAEVEFQPDTRLIGFGARLVYAVRRDEDDLEYVQAIPLPALPPP